MEFCYYIVMTVAGAIIRNNLGQYLLQLRDNKAPSYKNCWTLFGGIVEAEEAPLQAILRELQEELGLNSAQIQSLHQVQDNVQDNGTLQIIFEVITNVTLDKLRLTEGRGMEYVPESVLFDRDFAFNIEAVLRRYTQTVGVPARVAAEVEE